MRQLKIQKSITNRSSEALDKYLVEIGRAPLISIDEEIELAQKIRKILLGFMNATKGRKIFIIVKDNNGQYYLMGDKDHGAQLAGDSEGAVTGAAYTERNHVGLTFTYNTPRAYTYEGDVENILGGS